jgi:hypothetical protein
MSYKVWRISYAGAPRDHHAIFVETEKDQSGQIFQIIGDIQSGMRYETKQAKKPENSASFQAKIFLGSVSTSKALQRPKKNQPPSASSTVPRMNGPDITPLSNTTWLYHTIMESTGPGSAHNITANLPTLTAWLYIKHPQVDMKCVDRHTLG